MTDPHALPEGWRLEEFSSIDSTNAEAIRRATDGAPAGLAIMAREQTKGRGRSGRSWMTAGNALAVTALVRPAMSPADAAAASFVAALAVYDLAKAELPADAPLAIKWPNDVMVGDRKLSGILLESSGARSGLVDWLVIGMGVNLAPMDYAEAPNAIDLVTAGAARRLDVREAAANLLGHLDVWLRRWMAEGFDPIRTAWRARARDLGRQVAARLPNETVHGRALDLAPDGALVLELADGGQRRIAAGDVFPLAESA